MLGSSLETEVRVLTGAPAIQPTLAWTPGQGHLHLPHAGFTSSSQPPEQTPSQLQDIARSI